MKNKGFTLIELLGVIIIIGLLSVLILYRVRSSINDSYEAVSEVSANNLVGALEDYCFQAKLSGEFNGCSYDFSTDTNTCNGFSFTGEKPTDGIISLSSDGVISGEVFFDDYGYNIFNNKVYSNDICIEINSDKINNYYVFNYINDEQIFPVEYSGYYKLEVWGAQGGNTIQPIPSYVGGKGGYSSGMVYLAKGTKLYINVGQKGLDCVSANATTAYNGGAGGTGCDVSSDSSGNTHYAAGGGGATHIALKSGLLSSFDINEDGLGSEEEIEDILIVAGAGGGAYYHTLNYRGDGGSGGGFIGVSGISYNGITTPTGGTQQAGGNGSPNGSFGIGGYSVNGGGAGFYGGGGSNAGLGTYGISGAGGGSGYIGNSKLVDGVMYCYGCSESNDPSSKTISTTGSSSLRNTISCPNGFSTDAISKCAKADNGYAKITYLGRCIDLDEF